MEVTEEALAAMFAVVSPHLDERQRCLLAGAQARALGRGGIAAVARAAGMARSTVELGTAEIDQGAVPAGRVRRSGAGRPKATERDPGLLAALDALVEPTARGDPESPLRWTCKSTRKLADELAAQGHPVSAKTVARLLAGMDYSLQDPTKKKEVVGNLSNKGREWQPKGTPVRVDVHDFPDPQVGKAIPYGIYDLGADQGWVSVGDDHDTAAFAVATIRRWWQLVGAQAYPQADRLLVTADAGGSNSYRSRLWKVELGKLAAETGLAVTVCHFPPGTSKWNRIEHRLFSQISMNWRGRPLVSHQVIVDLIGKTTTRTGLKVPAERDRGAYPTGLKVADAELAAVPLTRHDWHGGTQPQRHLGRLHRLLDHPQQFSRQDLQVDLLAQPRAERLDRLGGVVAAPVEAPVDRPLDAAAGRLEHRGDRHGGHGDGQARGPPQELAEPQGHSGIGATQQQREQPVGQCAADDAVQVVEPIAEDRRADRQRQDRQTDTDAPAERDLVARQHQRRDGQHRNRHRRPPDCQPPQLLALQPAGAAKAHYQRGGADRDGKAGDHKGHTARDW